VSSVVKTPIINCLLRMEAYKLGSFYLIPSSFRWEKALLSVFFPFTLVYSFFGFSVTMSLK